MVRAPVGDHAHVVRLDRHPAAAREVHLAGVLPHAALVAAEARIRRLGRAALPEVPVEVAGHGLLRGQVVLLRIVGQAHLHAHDLAETALAHALGGVDEVLLRAFLRARAEDAPVLLRGVHDRASLADGHRHRLLEEHVLAGTARLDGHLRVPVVRYGDQHAVDGGIGEEATVVLIAARVGHEVASLHLLARELAFQVLEAHEVDVRQRDELAERASAVFQARRHVVGIGDASAPNHAERELLRRRPGAQHARGHEDGRRARRHDPRKPGGGPPAESTPRHFHDLLHVFILRYRNTRVALYHISAFPCVSKQTTSAEYAILMP